MKIVAVFAFAMLTLICGLKAAGLWRDSTKITPEPRGFEPVLPELKQGWRDLARNEASEKSSTLNRKAAFWTAFAAIFGFVSAVAGLWPI